MESTNKGEIIGDKRKKNKKPQETDRERKEGEDSMKRKKARIREKGRKKTKKPGSCINGAEGMEKRRRGGGSTVRRWSSQ